MNSFEFSRATDVADAVHQMAADPDAAFVAGGTNLIDLIKEGVTKPSKLIDITRLPLKSTMRNPHPIASAARNATASSCST